MGIKNLLKELKPITASVRLSHFSDQICGVDASCWLHRASISCAIALISGKPTNKFLHFTLRCIKALMQSNITPIIVFDGARLPMKSTTENNRNNYREENKAKALKYMKLGDQEAAFKYACAAVRITNQMVTGFINQCIEHHIQFICAPYEADAQLGYLYKHNLIDFVITEDSDLLLYGVQKVLYKFDPKKSCGDLVNMNEIYNYKINANISDKKKKSDLCLFLQRFWTKDPKEFIYVCVLSGCDYVKNLKGIGIKTAVKYCTENRNIDDLLDILTKKKSDIASKDYLVQFKRAVFTFMHHRVYDMIGEKLVHLNPLPVVADSYLKNLKLDCNDNRLNFLGEHMDDDIAKRIAKGKLDARSLTLRTLVSDHWNNNKINDINKHTNIKKKEISRAVVCFPHSYMCSRDNKILFCTTCANYLILKH